jgi:LPXTG-motif cell wall-anchored protein
VVTTPPSSGADGSVHGIVWFDRNHNAAFDGSEWVLPGVTVTLDQPVGVSRVAAASSDSQVIAQASPTPPRTAVTAADGSYTFTGLPAGDYRVTAAAAINGFDYTSDTDGAADWKVAVNVVAKATSVADFAGLGHGTLAGQVFEQGTKAGIARATVQCVWSGYDDVLGNADDVVLSVTADDAGSFDMAGVPYGYFSCDGRDRANNRVSADVSAHVMSAEVVRTPLPLSSSVASAAAPAASLPMTGGDSVNVMRLAVALILAGVVTVLVARRRRDDADA